MYIYKTFSKRNFKKTFKGNLKKKKINKSTVDIGEILDTITPNNFFVFLTRTQTLMKSRFFGYEFRNKLGKTR